MLAGIPCWRGYHAVWDIMSAGHTESAIRQCGGALQRATPWHLGVKYYSTAYQPYVLVGIPSVSDKCNGGSVWQARARHSAVLALKP